MIKLNNKNITYVALADTNNSLKAPKEIWYADSSNSVKLVYRRKDALIEGEDYEKYHWLDGDGSAYIDTEIIIPTEKVAVSTKIIITSNSFESTFFNAIPFSNRQGGISYPLVGVIHRRDNQVLYNDIANPRKNIYYNLDEIITINEVMTSSPQRGRDSLCFFYKTNLTFTPMVWDGKISNFEVESLESAFKISLVPCKLLKPVPKWLDANGIRRQVGECGMIDLVSGKFYGNVNSVGTFTVENYYEKKEWLVGDGSAYIDTGHNTNEDLDWETKVDNIRDNTFLFWFRTIQGMGDESMIVRTTPSRFRYANNSNEFEDNLTSQPINVETFGTTIFINGIGHSIIKYYPRPSILFRLFYAEVDASSQATVDTGYTTNNVGCSYFRFLDSNRNYIQNLIPCTLTMDLPASMDANNIARTKGTSGMWDLVSDRFYGNVANSGTFKAVNLAEGVDYEVHQWLRTEVNTKATLMTLDINSYSFSFSRKPLKGSNVPYFYTEGLDIYLYSDSDHTIRIWNTSQYGYYYSNTPFNWGDTISITSSSNSLVVNSQVIPQNTFPCKYVYFGANDTNGAEHYTSSITVDGIERYIPVKLLRPIPSKYDANGVARQAGECGMYDTVNDVFYGNVASSGTFSVSDDS